MSKTDKINLPPTTLKQLSRRSDFKGLTQLAGHLAVLLMAGLGMHFLQGSIWFVPLLLIYSVLLIFLFAPLHETIHFTVFKTRWMNNLVAAPIGFLLLTGRLPALDAPSAVRRSGLRSPAEIGPVRHRRGPIRPRIGMLLIRRER